MEISNVFEGVFKIDSKLCTVSLSPGHKVYGEKLVEIDGKEYRLWNPYRSKLAAAILKGMKNMEIKEGSKVLYLGAATGTTCSHVSDIIGKNGIVYCIEISERNMRQLVNVCDVRPNMFPIMADARYVDKYSKDLEPIDVIYQDVSSPEQAEILIENARLLGKGKYAYIAIKSQSIDVSKKPELVYKEVLAKLSKSFEVLEKIDLMPYDAMHLFVVLRKL